MLADNKDTKLFEVDLALIDESDTFRDETFDESLGRDLELEGLLSFPIVRRSPLNPSRFEIVDGHSRIRELRRLGESKVLCHVVDVDDVDAIFIGLKMNLKRKSCNPMWLARKVDVLHTRYKMRLKDIASRLGFSKSYISKCNSFNKLPIEVQDALAHGQITVDEAYALVSSSRRIPDVDVSVHTRACDGCGRVAPSQDVRELRLCVYCVADLRGKRVARVHDLERSLDCAVCKSTRKVDRVALCRRCLTEFKRFLKGRPIQADLRGSEATEHTPHSTPLHSRTRERPKGATEEEVTTERSEGVHD